MLGTLDVIISLGVIFLVLSMIHKYVMSIIKRAFRIKARTVASEMGAFVGENTAHFLIPYLDKKARHLNFLEDTSGGTKGLRQLNKEQLKVAVDGLSDFLKNKDVEAVVVDLGVIIPDKIKEKFTAIKTHLTTLEARIEAAYDNTVQKIEKLYEDRIRIVTFMFGMIVAVFINADFFEIYENLTKDAIVRDKLAAQAETVQLKMSTLSSQMEMREKQDVEAVRPLLNEIKETTASLTEELDRSGIIFGWTKEKINKTCSSTGSFLLKEFGLVASGLLISFGAPFWHEFLSSFVGIRKKLRG